ncbi:hypothetical protein BDW42DRAFT_172052, partial [Aspergillus taichungensis]
MWCSHQNLPPGRLHKDLSLPFTLFTLLFQPQVPCLSSLDENNLYSNSIYNHKELKIKKPQKKRKEKKKETQRAVLFGSCLSRLL